jgi:hypothetical protein
MGSIMPEKKALDNYFETFYFLETQIGVKYSGLYPSSTTAYVYSLERFN